MRKILLGLVLGAAVQAEELPDCRLVSMAGGQTQSLKELAQGKVVYLDFWASWCSSCAHSFRFLNALEQELADRGLAVIGVNLDEDPGDAEKFLARFPARFTVLADQGAWCAKAFAVAAMPAAYLIDRHGRVRYHHLGFRPAQAEAIRAEVEALLGER